MALQSPRDAYGSPPLARVIAASTAAVLHQQSGAAPVGVNHLPSGIICHNVGNLVWLDASGTTVTTVVGAVASGGVVGVYLPIAPAELTVANAVAVTVFWHRGATKTP